MDVAVRLMALVGLLPPPGRQDPGDLGAPVLTRLRLLLAELAQEIRDSVTGTLDEMDSAYERHWTEAWTTSTRDFLVAGTSRPAEMVPPPPWRSAG
jgi:hypothetical protein